MNDILQKLDEEAAQRLAHPQCETFLEKKMKEYAIDDDTVYPDPDYLIEMGGTPTMPKGNLVALSAKWKNGKTFFCDILCAVYLGSERFAGCRSRHVAGKVVFFDTEQAVSDTARIRKTIKAMTREERHDDLAVYCLRNAGIDNEGDSDDISRFDFISQTIAHKHPDLVVIDGIADLIYNYNDVIESQEVVNKLAAIANENDCCIVVVMHQNKGSHDRNMKGHLGTMLFQKCSDVFNIEKCGSVFVASHTVTRHSNCQDICFKLDANAVPMDAVADRQLQVELERQQYKAKLHEQIFLCFEDATARLKRSDIVKMIQEKLGYANRKSYEMFNQAVGLGILKTEDNRHYFLQPPQADYTMDAKDDPQRDEEEWWNTHMEEKG